MIYQSFCFTRISTIIIQSVDQVSTSCFNLHLYHHLASWILINTSNKQKTTSSLIWKLEVKELKPDVPLYQHQTVWMIQIRVVSDLEVCPPFLSNKQHLDHHQLHRDMKRRHEVKSYSLIQLRKHLSIQRPCYKSVESVHCIHSVEEWSSSTSSSSDWRNTVTRFSWSYTPHTHISSSGTES